MLFWLRFALRVFFTETQCPLCQRQNFLYYTGY